jgi:hypothetical protein
MNSAKRYAKKYLRNVHAASVCEGEHCVIHNPSDHHMRSWPLIWRGDRKMFERVCEHGIGHPDPDHPFDKTHGCDGCCFPPKN